MTDGNFISTRQGEGAAHWVEPFTPDQTPYIQMNQVLIAKQHERALARKKEQEEREERKAAWMKEMRANHKYDPVDRPVVEREQKRILDLIYKDDGSAKSRFAIDDALLGMNKFLNDSSSLYDQYLKKEADRTVNSDRVYYAGEDRFRASRKLNEAQDLPSAFDSLGERAANIESFTQEEEKIKDIPNYLSLEVTKLKPVSYETEQRPTEYGYTSVNVPKYDKEALRNLSSMLYKEKRSLREFYKDENELYNAMLPYQSKAEKPTAKGIPSEGRSNVSGGGAYQSGKMVLSPVQDYVFTDVKSQDKAYRNYIEQARRLRKKETDEKKRAALKTAEISEDEFKRRHPYSYNMKVIPLSVVGLAENPSHKFNVMVDGVWTEIEGQPIKYSITKDSFVLQDKKTGETYLAPVSKNPQYLTDSDQTEEDFRKAIKIVEKGNYTTTGKGGDVIKVEKATKKEINRKDIPAKAAAAGYTPSEYEKILKQNGVIIK